MNELLIGLVGALVATNQPLAVSNIIQQQSGLTVQIPNPGDPTENALRDIMISDDAALDEVDGWVQSNNVLRAQGKAETDADLNRRIRARLDLVRQAYQAFLQQHPNYVRGYLAYGSFLNQLGEEENAKTQFENARQLDPTNPAAWNNLANYYGEYGGVTNAFVDYAEASRLAPGEPVYLQNLATTVYLFRQDAATFYHLTEPQVFDKALDLYRQAMKLDPANFVLATDYAESYYEIKPLRTNDTLLAWTNALQVATTEAEREGVEIHLARVKMMIGQYAGAQAILDTVTNLNYTDLKKRLEHSLSAREHPPTNDVPVITPSTNTSTVTFPTTAMATPTYPATNIFSTTNAVAPDLDTNLLITPRFK